MRTGPGKNYPAKWLYRRADLPIKVLEVYPSWRKVQDPDGETGWMLVNLLSDTRTAIVTGNEPRPMHEAPNAGARDPLPGRSRAWSAASPNARAIGASSTWAAARLHPHRPYLGRRPGRKLLKLEICRRALANGAHA
jgi:hypothetical protein